MHIVILSHLDADWQKLCIVYIETISYFQGLILDMVNWKHGSLCSSCFGCQSPPYISLVQALPPPFLNLIPVCSPKEKSHGTTMSSYLIYSAVNLFLKQYIPFHFQELRFACQGNWMAWFANEVSYKENFNLAYTMWYSSACNTGRLIVCF